MDGIMEGRRNGRKDKNYIPLDILRMGIIIPVTPSYLRLCPTEAQKWLLTTSSLLKSVSIPITVTLARRNNIVLDNVSI